MENKKKRECLICGDKYIGCRIICDKKPCFYGYQSIRNENRRKLGIHTFDYLSPRSLVVDFPIKYKVNE